MQPNQPHLKITLNKSMQNEAHLTLPIQILNFSLPPLHSEDFHTPFELPESVATNPAPFEFIRSFAENHKFKAGSPTIRLPIATCKYAEIVDEVTYSMCEKFTNLEYVEEAAEILKLAKWLQFEAVEKAVAAAIAVNYYTGYDEREVEEFISRNQLEGLTCETRTKIWEDHRGLFERIQMKGKEQFMKE